MPRSSSHSKSQPPAVFRNPYSSVGNTTPHVEQPTLGQTLKQGFGFGAGSAIAHRIFGAVPTIITPTDKKTELLCEKELIAFQNCMQYKTADEFCGLEQSSYTQCLRLSKGSN